MMAVSPCLSPSPGSVGVTLVRSSGNSGCTGCSCCSSRITSTGEIDEIKNENTLNLGEEANPISNHQPSSTCLIFSVILKKLTSVHLVHTHFLASPCLSEQDTQIPHLKEEKYQCFDCQNERELRNKNNNYHIFL